MMKNLKFKKWLPGLIMLIGCIMISLMVVFGEEDEMIVTSVKPMSVETISIQKTDYQIQVRAWGFVEPRESIDIRVEIPGKISTVPKNIFAGAMVMQGDILFTIDDRNYRNAMAEAIAAKNLAQQSLEIEKGRQAIAKTEWALLEKSKWQGHKNKSLALRKPQLKEREAAVQIAFAKEEQARFDVERAEVNAPCRGVILSEHIAVGKILDTGDIGLNIGCTECYHITALFPAEYSIDPDSRKVIVRIGSNRYEGVVKAVLPQINSETRHKQVLVEFQGEGVTLGAYAMTILPGPHFKNVSVLPKTALRSGNTIWLLSKNNTLELRAVTVLAQDMENVVVGKGLTETDRVILTHISSPLSGMNLSMLSQQPKKYQNIKSDGEEN